MCSLRFENNLLTIEGFRFASISKKTPLSKLSFAFVSLALPLLNIPSHATVPSNGVGQLASLSHFCQFLGLIDLCLKNKCNDHFCAGTWPTDC